MIVSLFVFFSSFSGVLLSYMFGNKKLNRMIPITLMGIMTILYVFGLAGWLKYGVFVVDILIALIYISFLIWIVLNRRNLKTHFLCIIPCMATWATFFVVINYCDKGMLVHNNDEFSHWAYTVKSMIMLDDFSTNSLSGSMFKSYPPAMSLLQYFFQKNKMWIKGDTVFTEWRLYLTYHMFSVSFLLPIFDAAEKMFYKISKVLVLIWISVLFFKDMPESLYIDPFVAALGGYAILSIVYNEKKDSWHIVNVTLSLICLVLSKDIGMYFALISGVIFLIDSLDYSLKNVLSTRMLYGVVPLLFSFGAKLLWKNELINSGVKINSNGLTGTLDYLKMLLFRSGIDYRQDVVSKAFHAFFESRLDMSVFNISYFIAFIVLFSCLAVALIKLRRNDVLSSPKCKTVLTGCTLMVLLYVLFIGQIYINNFGEYEAVNLASYERYVNMPFVCYALVALYSFMKSWNFSFNNSHSLAIFAVILGLVFGLNGSIYEYISRTDVKESEQFMYRYRDIYPTISAYCSTEDSIYFVSIADKGLDRLAATYLAKPYRVQDAPWSLGGPYYEGDIWSKQISQAEWMNELQVSYDYVYIYNAIDLFVDEYSECFDDPSTVTSGSLYYIDKEKNVLIRVN